MNKLDEFSRQLIARHILQEHDQAATAAVAGLRWRGRCGRDRRPRGFDQEHFTTKVTGGHRVKSKSPLRATSARSGHLVMLGTPRLRGGASLDPTWLSRAREMRFGRVDTLELGAVLGPRLGCGLGGAFGS